MRKKLTAIVIVAIMLFSLIGCGTQSSNTTATDTKVQKTKGFTVAILNGQPPYAWRDQYMEGIKKTLDKDKASGILADYIIYNTKTDEEANTALNDALNRHVDGVQINPANEDGIAASVAKLVAAGITVFSMATGPYPGTIRLDSDVIKYKQIPVSFVAEAMGGKGNLIYISGPDGEGSQVMYDKLVADQLAKYPGIKMVGRAPGNYDPSQNNKAAAALLAANPKIDGLLGEAGQMGAITAFQAAKRPLPPMIGDFSFEFLRAWKKLPELNAIVTPYPPGIGPDSVEFLIRLLQGKKIKESLMEPMPGKTDGSKHVTLPVAYFVVKAKDPNAAWLKDIDPRTKVIDLDEALKLGEGKSDSWSLDKELTEQEVDAYFN